MTELVSVIIPTYNYGHFVSEAVDSAPAQTYSPVEVIVVDDGSEDDTQHKLKLYGDRIRYIFQNNKGLCAARNTGIRTARGSWVALLDSDDIWHPQKLDIQLSVANAQNDIGLIGSHHSAILPEALNTNPSTIYLSIKDMLLSAMFGPSGAVIRRDCALKIGLFDESLHGVSDRDMWLRLTAESPCIFVDSPCWWYRLHSNQMSRDADRMLDDYRKVLDKFFCSHPQFSGFRRLAKSYMYYDAVWPYFAGGRRLTAIKNLIQSILEYPFDWDDLQSRGNFHRIKVAARLLAGSQPRQ